MHSQQHGIIIFSYKHNYLCMLHNLIKESEGRLVLSPDLFCWKVCLTVVFPLCEDDGENSMGPAAGLIHVGSSYSSVFQDIQAELTKYKTLWI